jgi:transposase
VRRKPIACTRCCRSANRKLGAALLSGEQDAAALAKLARGRLRAKRPALRQALAGRVTAQHRVLLRHILTFLDFFDGQLEQLTAEIERAQTPFADAVALVQTLPGVAESAASAIVAPDRDRDESLPLGRSPRLLGRGLPQKPTERWPALE